MTDGSRELPLLRISLLLDLAVGTSYEQRSRTNHVVKWPIEIMMQSNEADLVG